MAQSAIPKSTSNYKPSSRLAQLFTYLRPHWQQVCLGLFALLIVNSLGIYIPLLIRAGIDTLQHNPSQTEIYSYMYRILGLATLMWVVRLTCRMALFGVGRKVEYELKQRLFEHLLTLEPAYFAQTSIGDVISRATSDINNIRRLVGFAMLSSTNIVLAYSLTLPTMLWLDARLSLMAIALYPLMPLLTRLRGRVLKAKQRRLQEQLAGLSELIQEDLSGISLLKIYVQEANERRAFRQQNADLVAAKLDLSRTRTVLFSFVQGIASLSLLVLLGVGSQQILNGSISVGDFLALLLYVERLAGPTALLGIMITTLQRGEVSIERVEAILMAQPQVYDRPEAAYLTPRQVRGLIEARGLTYRYPEAKDLALHDVHFRIEAGETVAIVGPIGSGKSTLANALPHLLPLEPGQLFLDGLDITTIGLGSLRRAIAYVPQDSFLFSDTIENNIRYGEPSRDRFEVELAAKDAQLQPEILNFPAQYDTLVGERGITLSGGQRQRTALARALIVEAPVLILDDALSSVDNQTATAILQSLTASQQRKTVIFIAHQLSAAAIADRILVMERGQLVQSGQHQTLLQQDGLYRSLWAHQQLTAMLN
ncbi:MAG: ABC transporter ATP-binding protein [Cyanobacteria bacterium P01_H01_bin.121]